MNVDVAKLLKDLSRNLDKDVSDVITLFSLPAEYIKEHLGTEGIKDYINIRNKMLIAFESIEIFVDKKEISKEQIVCHVCGEPLEIATDKKGNQTLKAEVYHWLDANGNLIHEAICYKCLKRGSTEF